MWFALYAVFAVLVAIFVLRDWKSDFKDLLRTEKIRKRQKRSSDGNPCQGPDGCSHQEVADGPRGKDLFRVFLSNWVEVGLLVFMTVLLVLREQFLKVALIALFLVLILRELFQMAVSLRRYVLSPENWLEVSTIALVGVILFHPDQGAVELKLHLAAIAIILSWAELITLVGKHPKLTRYNVYVTMFYKASNFLKVLPLKLAQKWDHTKWAHKEWALMQENPFEKLEF